MGAVSTVTLASWRGAGGAGQRRRRPRIHVVARLPRRSRLTAIGIVLLVGSMAAPVTPDADATTISPVGTFPGAQSVSAAPNSGVAGTVLVAAQTTLSDPGSLLVLSPGAPPFRVAGHRWAGGAVSANGRYAVWAKGSCHSLSFGRLDLGSASRSPQPLGVPRRFQRATVEGINVSSSGRVTALVSTYDSLRCGGGSGSSTPPGTVEAVLSAASGARSLSVVADAPQAVAAANPAGVEDVGAFSVSPDASTFVLCSYLHSGARSAVLVDLRNDQRLLVRRATAKASSRIGQVECAAGNSGAAMMLANVRGLAYLVSIQAASPRAAMHRVEGLIYLTMSPAGNQAFANDDSGNPVIVDLRSGRVTPITAPAGWHQCCNVQGAEGGFEYDQELGSFSGVGVFGWATPEQIIANPNRHLLILNARTHRWSKPGARVGPSGIGFTVFCPLPSGRILIANGTSGADIDSYRLYLSNRTGARVDAVSTGQVGAIHDISCAPGGNTVFVSVGKYPAKLYAANATAINGSPWTK
jgi:hypothetical protein